MITYEMIINAQENLVEYWGEDGKKVIEECAKVTPFNASSKIFLNNCTCCDGDWEGMLLSGIQKLYPNVWEAIPKDMGTFIGGGICNTLILCGVDTSG
jgi:hypothetical protein